MNNKFNKIKYNVSVVIPTLGGRQLIDTVLSLNKSSIIPVEIIQQHYILYTLQA